MKMKPKMLLVLLAGCALLGVLAWRIHAEGQAKQSPGPRWEYLRVEVSQYGWEQEMNKLGAEGWELVQVRRVVETFGLRFKALLERGMTPTVSYEYIFKRPR